MAKFSQNPFRKGDIVRWASELAAWRQADEYELRLVGTPESRAAADLRSVGNVNVSPVRP